MDSKKKVLVVEDDNAVALGLKHLLQTEGYRVRVVNDGRDAIAQTHAFRPDMLLLDLNLPRLSGFEVCRALRTQGYRGCIVILTARTEQVDKMVGFEAGADDFVTKPFEGAEILARARAHFREHERLQGGQVMQADSSRPERRLLAVMFTDMKDFSKRMNENERTGLAMLKKHNTIVAHAVKRHRGRIVEIIGDAFMVAFENALQSVKCGMDILRKLKRYNLRRPARERIQVRIGIHLGDVIQDADKLRGDTINIAARLQQRARADHMVVSESVVEAIKGKLSTRLTHLGKRQVKNIKQPIVIYSITI